jgi:ATP-binding cassette subfamily B protein
MLPKKLFSFICFFLRPYKLVNYVYFSLALAAGFWGPFNSIIVKNIINLLPEIKIGNEQLLLWPISLIVLNFIVFDNFTWRGIAYIRYKYHGVIINEIIKKMMNLTLKHSHQFFQDNFSGAVSKQITNLADGIEQIIGHILTNFLRSTSLLIGAFITAYFVNPLFCAIFIIWFTCFASVSIFMSQKLVGLSDVKAASESIVVGQLLDAISNQSNIKMFAKRKQEMKRMDSFLNQQLAAYKARDLFALILHMLQGGMIAIMIASVSYGLVYLHARNQLSTGDFALIIGLAMELGHMMWYTMSQVDEFNKAVGRCKQSLSSLIINDQISDKLNAQELQVTKGQITFEQVKFHYKNTTPLFENKTIAIEAGEKVGLVGYSGSGKSSFVNLILRLYDINEGKITIDKQNISEVTQDSLHNAIAIIPQDPSLFHRSLMENIRYARIEASDEEVIKAAKQAHAHEFISKLSEGYNSMVGERGIKLSGGQRQRIAIARAILKNAPILILDEATSQLDSITENDIQDSLWQLMQNKTTLVIAHRLSTLLHMDRILVFDNGKIVEDGSHKALIEKKGLYKNLWDAQVGGFLPEKK